MKCMNLAIGSFALICIFMGCLKRLDAQQSDFCTFTVPGEVVCDDFSDGSATDNMPANWEIIGLVTQTVEDNSLIITSSAPEFPATQLVFPETTFSDISVRAQVRLLDGEQIGFAVRDTPSQSRRSYGAGIWNDKVFIGFGGSGGTLGEEPISLDVAAEDVLMQFDAIGNHLELWVWPAGENMPVDPVISVVDDSIASGPMFIWAGQGTGGGVASGAFRFVHVATTHIPEPSTSVLSVLGLLYVLQHGRRHGRV